ncbi:MAG: 4'-phosphopantetheinyl transferase superfamily protein [Spongiibacteraceae bacterium]
MRNCEYTLLDEDFVQLKDNDVHLWMLDIQQVSDQQLAGFRQLMSAQELERNQRYRFAKDQKRDCITRGLVRTTLSRYSDLAPEAWAFNKGDHGKPEIINSPVPLRFNLSHTFRYIVCAVTPRWNVGVDVEHTERKNDVREIAKHYFSEQEVSDLFALDEVQQLDTFFDYWTLKEAYMKASGEGLSLGLGNFSFNLGNPISLSLSEVIKDSASDWHFQLYHPRIDHRMAVAVKSGAVDPCIQLFDANNAKLA